MKAGLSLLVLFTSLSFAQAATHIVKVNGDGQVTFAPNKVSALPGDTIELEFSGGIPELVESWKAPPCESKFEIAGFENPERGFEAATQSLILRIRDSLYTLLSVIRRGGPDIMIRRVYSPELSDDKDGSGDKIKRNVLSQQASEASCQVTKRNALRKRCYGIVYGCVWERDARTTDDSSIAVKRYRFRNITKRTRFHTTPRRGGVLSVSIPIIDGKPIWVFNSKGEVCSETFVLAINVEV